MFPLFHKCPRVSDTRAFLCRGVIGECSQGGRGNCVAAEGHRRRRRAPSQSDSPQKKRLDRPTCGAGRRLLLFQQGVRHHVAGKNGHRARNGRVRGSASRGRR
jgi:hypothetical protein